jgi:hypothetical protein
MEENINSIESLIEKATEYGKTSFELAKLKAVDKTAEVVSSFLSHSLVLIIISSFLLFLSLGAALWLGEILGKFYLGFFIVAAFYGVTGIFVHFIFHKWISKCVGDSIIKQMLKQTPWNQ